MTTSKKATAALNYFVSGSNHAGEIRGLAETGWNVGVAAPELGPSAEAELCKLAGTDTKVFIDSGAFGEITFENGYPEVKEEITDEEWNKRLDTYERLAAVLGGQLSVVAPDKVAFQEETLARLEKYAARVRKIASYGANVIVPVQKGKLPMADFAECALAVLDMGVEEVIFGIPSKKDATSIADMGLFSEWLADVSNGATRVHLLGMGIKSKNYSKAASAITSASPNTTVFSDSVRITALVGRGKRKDGTERPRPLTAALDKVKATGMYRNATEWKAAAMRVVFGAEMAALASA